MMTRCDSLLKMLFILIWSIVVLHMYAEYHFFYWTYRWLDIPMHFLGGVWVGLVALWLVYCSGWRVFGRYASYAPFPVALVGGVLFGVVWEGYDFFMWSIASAGFPHEYLQDSALDLVMDGIGAITGYFIFCTWFDTSKTTCE